MLTCNVFPPPVHGLLPLPGLAGVAGFVVNEKNEVLLIQERWIRKLKIVHWKLPGGHAETGMHTYVHVVWHGPENYMYMEHACFFCV